MNCKKFQEEFQELVLNPAASSSGEVQQHLVTCTPCQQEYTTLRATMSLMDTWTTPEPSPYFDSKLAVLLREEQAAPRLGLFARLRDRFLFNTGRQFRPAFVGAMALVLMLGGGSYAGLQTFNHPAPKPQVSAAVNDLQILDKDAQTIQQMDQLLQDDDANDDTQEPS